MGRAWQSRLGFRAALPWVAGVVVLTSCGNTRESGPWDGWSRLRLATSSPSLLSGSIELDRHQQDDRRLLLTTSMRATVLGATVAESLAETEIDPISGRVRSLVTRSSKRARRYTFDDEGYTVEKLGPPADARAPLDQWEVKLSQRFDNPTDSAGQAVQLLDYYGMMFRLGELELETVGDSATVHVATSDGPAAYRIRVGQERRYERTFRAADGEPRTVATREFRLRIEPADPSRADEGFLRMEGAVELWVEAGSKTLLELSGSVPRIPGRVELILDSLG